MDLFSLCLHVRCQIKLSASSETRLAILIINAPAIDIGDSPGGTASKPSWSASAHRRPVRRTRMAQVRRCGWSIGVREGGLYHASQNKTMPHRPHQEDAQAGSPSRSLSYDHTRSPRTVLADTLSGRSGVVWLCVPCAWSEASNKCGVVGRPDGAEPLSVRALSD